MNESLRSVLLAWVVTPLAIGCSSPASEHSPESVRDPLRIERAVNDYYFPNGVPENDDASTDTDGEQLEPGDSLSDPSTVE